MKTEISKMMAARKRELKHVKRVFPKFHEGMTVARYCVLYESLNSKGDVNMLSFDLRALNHVPTAYDPSLPEVTEGVL